VPSSGRSAPTKQRSNVDLPAPLRPVSAIASPVRTSRLNRSKIVFGPKARRSPETFRMVVRLATWAFCPLRQAGQTAPLNSDRPIQRPAWSECGSGADLSPLRRRAPAVHVEPEGMGVVSREM
jgi:hypothetical protein